MKKSTRIHSDKLLNFIQDEEGNIESIQAEANAKLRGKDRSGAQSTLNRIHPSNSGEGLKWGAYYDSRGYLTAGSGTLISQSKRGSKEEARDIAGFKNKYLVDPFTLTKEQARVLIGTRLDENINDYVNTEHGKGVEYDSLPTSAKMGVASLAYNIGGHNLGKKGIEYSASLKRAANSKTAADWEEFQYQQKNFHGKLKQEAGVIRRRKKEAFMMDDLTYGQDSSILPEGETVPARGPAGVRVFDDVEDLFTPKPDSSPIMDTIKSNMALVSDAQADDDDGAPVGENIPTEQSGDVLPEDRPIAHPFTRQPVESDGSILNNTRRDQVEQNMNQAKAQEDKPLLESLKDFRDHVGNSFMTESVIGSTVKKAAINWKVNTEYDPTFQPTDMLDYKELVEKIPTENLKDLLEGSVNEQQFRNRAIGFQIEQKAREEISHYMSTNPVAGFVGLGLASAIDVTSLIPVSKIAKLSGITKSLKGIPLIAQNIGMQVGENVIQDLVQETMLTQNSDIRKWDDGEILYGMVGGVVLGGAAGVFRTNKHLGRFTKLAKKMNAEKNLSGINRMIMVAEKGNIGAKGIKELKQLRTVIEQSLNKDHRLLVMAEIGTRQEAMGKGLKDTKKIQTIDEHMNFVSKVDEQIELRKPEVVNEKLESFKTAKQEASTTGFNRKQEVNREIVPLKKELKDLQKLPKSSSTDSKIKKATKKLEAAEKRMKKVLDETNYDLKKIKSDKAKFTRTLAKSDVYNQDITIKSLQDSKLTKEAELKQSLQEFNQSVDAGTHPELAAMIEPQGLGQIADELGFPKGTFNNLDEVDEFLGLKFDDSLSAARTRLQPSKYLEAQDVNEMFNKTDPELWNVVSRQFQESRDNPALGIASFQVNKNSVAAKIARATKMNQLLTSESVVGRLALNKSALKWSKNEFASAFYNWAAPDGVGRNGGGKLSVIEAQQMLQNIYGGQLRTVMNDSIDKLKPLMLSNKQLRTDLELPSNDLAARLFMTEAYFPEKVANLLRDEMIEQGNAGLKYGDEIGAIVDSWRKDFNTLSARILKDAKEAGVKGVDEIENSDNWFHRSWDNKAAMEFDMKHGTAKMEELIEKGMREHLTSLDKEITAAMEAKIKSQAKKFAFGLRSKDTRVFMTADTNYKTFMNKLIDADVDGIDPDVLKREVRRIEDNVAKNKERELARRKPISLTASLTLDDGTTVSIKDLLENNIVASQASYVGSMSGRIAAARNGIADVNLLDEWVDRATELERKRGNLDSADYIERSMREDVESVKYGYAHREANIDGGLNRIQRMAMKYNAARLMQYTGISSIAEMNTLIAEAGYKAVAQVVVDNAVPLLKSYLWGGVSGKVFRDTMYDELSIMTGIGLEDISFDALLSSSRMVSQSKAGRMAERVVDNASKLTRRATGHVEVTGRRLALNSLAINMGNIALGKDRLGNMFGGASNVNMVELGFADLVNGKAVLNSNWTSIVDSIKKHALDEDGNVAAQSGKNIRQFNLTKWDQNTKTKFTEALVQQTNHILVNPDSTTAKLWHNTWWGSMFNQFKSFSNNAQSKVAGHNLNQAVQGYKMGEMAEFSKLAQKYFWGAALGKLSLVLYGSINNAGREDFAERMEKYMGVDEFRDWTQALGRSSAITGIDGPIDTLIGLGNLTGQMQVNPLFDSSTIGQSRDRLSWQTTATGQLATGAQAVGASVLGGDFSKAGQQALKLSPFRRQLGVNQLLNAMGVD
jgi:GH24 family phage-related lysozyme (muramidase)